MDDIFIGMPAVCLSSLTLHAYDRQLLIQIMLNTIITLLNTVTKLLHAELMLAICISSCEGYCPPFICEAPYSLSQIILYLLTQDRADSSLKWLYNLIFFYFIYRLQVNYLKLQSIIEY